MIIGIYETEDAQSGRSVAVSLEILAELAISRYIDDTVPVGMPEPPTLDGPALQDMLDRLDETSVDTTVS